MKEIKDIIRGIREDRDLKQKDIAQILKVNQQYYSKYENGEYEIPCRHIIKLCKYYDISADYILGLIDFEVPIGGNSYKSECNDIKLDNIISGFNKLNHKDKVCISEYIKLIEIKGSKLKGKKYEK